MDAILAKLNECLAEVHRLRAELVAVTGRVNALENLVDGDDADDEEGNARLRFVVDWRYRQDTHDVEVRYATMHEDFSVEVDADWSRAPGVGPYGGGGTHAVKESY